MFGDGVGPGPGPEPGPGPGGGEGVEDVHFCRLSSSDVVRHRLVSDIVEAYGRWEIRPGGSRDSRHRPNKGN